MYTTGTRTQFLALVRTGQHKALRQFMEELSDGDLTHLERDTAALVGSVRADRQTREAALLTLAESLPAENDPQVAALLRERAGYAQTGRKDQAAEVDAELRRHGYTQSVTGRT